MQNSAVGATGTGISVAGLKEPETVKLIGWLILQPEAWDGA